MSQSEIDATIDKITKGVKLSIERLIERIKKEDGDLVVSKNGKVVRIKARDLKPEDRVPKSANQ
jgi:hypothetical protein